MMAAELVPRFGSEKVGELAEAKPGDSYKMQFPALERVAMDVGVRKHQESEISSAASNMRICRETHPEMRKALFGVQFRLVGGDGRFWT